MQLKPEISTHDHVQGAGHAPVTLVEYGDYECPHCARAHGVVCELQEHFGAKLRFAFRNFPLSQIHPLAEAAAEAAEFAGSQGKFWQMHDALMEQQSLLSHRHFSKLAGELGLDVAALEDALAKGAFTERVKQDFMSGVRSGVNGTPTFFINGARHDEAPDFESLARRIAAAAGR